MFYKCSTSTSPSITLIIYMGSQKSVSHIVPTVVQLPPTHPFIPSPSPQASSICLLHHVPHTYLSQRHPCTSNMTSLFRLYTCPPPSPSDFFWMLNLLIHVLPYIYNLLILQYTLFDCLFITKYFLGFNKLLMNDFACLSTHPASEHIGFIMSTGIPIVIRSQVPWV
jgi:hypothetical protein